ncbi:MAG: RrF2 family transcriptional regulator [Akkermansia sp.]|nr:RrF2 family transcriptional regulator [Akkermansia sp.]MEE1266120.1 RrF2 family transcriptional regulator [Akkermansia sp.]
MMRISTKGRYALRIMLDLAQNDDLGPVALREISERQNITPKYMESIMSMLLRDKLVQSLRGKAGGYQLTRKPEEYPIYEILSCAEGGLAPVHCLAMEENECPIRNTCLTIPVWEGLHQVIKDYLSGITLKTLIEQGVNCV